MIDNKFIVPDAIKNRSLKYLTDTHYIFSWFSGNYQRVDVKNQTALDYISLRDVYNHLTRPEYYRNLAPAVKLTLSQKYFINLFVTNKLYNRYYIYKVNTCVQGKECKRTDVLKGWQLIVEEDKKLTRIDTQQVNEIFKNVNNNSNNTSSTSTSL